EETAKTAATTSTDTGATALVFPGQATEAADIHHGQGGLYTMKDGQRVRVEHTQQPKTGTTQEQV
ncbi:MAG: hypothetical protein K2X78_02920, partial [Burkholderiaceae bacterium]|nr:hypothetical protein [Burkholderiaceae bacterium]